MKLEISLFRFDAQSDYLPYYTKHYVKIQEEKNLLDVLKTINEESSFGFDDDENCGIVVNGIYTTVALSLEQIKKDFGDIIKLEPLSIRRAYKDLLINEDDFYDKLALLEENHLNHEEGTLYEKYKLYYYASNTLNFNKDYIGDAFILLVHDLIKNDKDVDKLKKLLLDKDNGIMFHTDLNNRVYELPDYVKKKIEDVQKKLNITKPIEEQNYRASSAKEIKFDEVTKLTNIKYSFENFNIAYYEGASICRKTQNIINSLSANFLALPIMTNDLAMKTFHINPLFTYALAAEVMLDAFDNGADFIVVDNAETFYLLDSHRKELEKVSGREIVLPVIHSSELIKLASGEHEEVKKSLASHSIDPEII